MRSVSAFIQAIISTVAVEVLGDGRHQPGVVELDGGQLLGRGLDRTVMLVRSLEDSVAHRYSPVEASMRSAATACRSRSRSMM